MNDARVRPATPDDAGAIRRIATDAWHAAYDEIIGAEAVEAVLEDWYEVDGLARAAGDDDHVFVVADAGSAGNGTDDPDSIVGFAHAALPPDGDVWNLIRIYVHPDRWGEGLGTALLDRVEDALEDRGVSTYELAVLADNDVGVSFYESRGFDRVGTERMELAGVETTEYWYRKEI